MTDTGPQDWIYVATGILFLLPLFLLFFAWRSLPKTDVPAIARWRKYFVRVGLLMAVASTLLHIIWNVSWLHSGGSPHGMGAARGIWLPLGRPLLWTFAIAAVLGLLAKGISRILLIGWTVSMIFVFFGIYILQME